MLTLNQKNVANPSMGNLINLFSSDVQRLELVSIIAKVSVEQSSDSRYSKWFWKQTKFKIASFDATNDPVFCRFVELTKLKEGRSLCGGYSVLEFFNYITIILPIFAWSKLGAREVSDLVSLIVNSS